MTTDHGIRLDPEPKQGGSPAAIVRHLRAAVRDGTDVKVPCGTCSLCCEMARAAPPLTDNERDRFPHTVDAYGGAKLARRENGWCVYLSDDRKCSIYAIRPRACRIYDCRVTVMARRAAEALYDVKFEYAHQPETVGDTPDWRFDLPTRNDVDVFLAIQIVMQRAGGWDVVCGAASLVVMSPEWPNLVETAKRVRLNGGRLPD